MTDLSKVVNTSTGSSAGNVIVTWDEAKSFAEASTGVAVNLTTAWEQNKGLIKALKNENYETMLVKGKRTTQALKVKAYEKSTSRIKFGEFNLNFAQRLAPEELNCQRLTALMAMCNAFLRAKGEKTTTAMGSAIPPTVGIDTRYDEVFHYMLAPGYGYLYKPLFMPTTATDIKTEEGDMGRYFAGAVELDWLQHCSTTSSIPLNEFAKGKFFINMNGTVRQIVTNTQLTELTMDEKSLDVYKKILGRNVYPMTGRKANDRIKAAVKTWVL